MDVLAVKCFDLWEGEPRFMYIVHFIFDLAVEERNTAFHLPFKVQGRFWSCPCWDWGNLTGHQSFQTSLKGSHFVLSKGPEEICFRCLWTSPNITHMILQVECKWGWWWWNCCGGKIGAYGTKEIIPYIVLYLTVLEFGIVFVLSKWSCFYYNNKSCHRIYNGVGFKLQTVDES